VVTAAPRLPLLDHDWPAGTWERIRAEAAGQAQAIADSATPEEIRQRLAESHPDLPPLAENTMHLARTVFQGMTEDRIVRELAVREQGAHAERLAAAARAVLATAYGLDRDALDGGAARRLMGDATRHAEALRDGARTPAEKAAATRAEHHADRLEVYLTTAGLARWDDEACELTFTDERTAKG
jgi:hypothetical protein